MALVAQRPLLAVSAKALVMAGRPVLLVAETARLVRVMVELRPSLAALLVAAEPVMAGRLLLMVVTQLRRPVMAAISR